MKKRIRDIKNEILKGEKSWYTSRKMAILDNLEGRIKLLKNNTIQLKVNSIEGIEGDVNYILDLETSNNIRKNIIKSLKFEKKDLLNEILKDWENV